MPLLPIQGSSQIFTAANSTYTNGTTGGVWSSGNSSIVTINAATGWATGISAGSTQIIYTVGADSTALNVLVKVAGRISNGFNPTLVLDALRNEILWPSQGQSNSSRHFTDFHPLCDELILKDLANIELGAYDGYIGTLNDAVIMECVNLVMNEPQLIDKSKLVFTRSDYSLTTTPVTNEGDFVGLEWQVCRGDYGMKLSNLILYFTEDVSFTIYLYNDFSLPPRYQIAVTAQAYEQVIINLQNDVILNYLSPTDNKGGTWRMGYYQSDLGTAQAIHYPSTFCGFRACNIQSFAAPVTNDVQGNRNFDRAAKRSSVGKTFGINLELSTMIDATNNIVSNPAMWGNMIGLKMACRLVEICKFTTRSNYVERAIESLGGVDELNTILNGRPYNHMTGVAKVTGLVSMFNDAVQVVKQGFRPVSIL